MIFKNQMSSPGIDPQIKMAMHQNRTLIAWVRGQDSAIEREMFCRQSAPRGKVTKYNKIA